MLRKIFIISPVILTILLYVPFSSKSQKCYELNKGSGLGLFSPFLNGSPRGKPQIKGANFGDSAQDHSCNGAKKRWVIGVYAFSKAEPIFAVHAGIATIYTTSSFVENNQANDAIWINGDTITTTYMGIIPIVATGQYVYAGQQVGNVLIDANIDNNFGIGIRRAPVLNPFHKRGYLPVTHDGTGECKCKNEPLWPEYFVDPSSPFIDYNLVNEVMPEATLKVNIAPSGVGQWSFDNGTTWLNGGDKISGLPFSRYKIIFKNEYGYNAPVTYNAKIFSTNRNLILNVSYTPDYTILKKPAAELQREDDQKLLNTKIAVAMDSLGHTINEDGKTAALRNSIIDSLNNRFTRIETIQKETFFFTKLFKYILPVLLLALSFMGILLFQNNKIRKQKKYLENLQKEQHHRVHNSLGVISSLLNKYKENIDPEKLANIDNSIVAISTVHRQLYKGSDIENICFQPVAENIAQSLLAQRGLNETVKTFIDADVIIPQKKSTTLALIFNELFTNSLKYAFEHTREKMIFLTLSAENDHFLMVYRDNGSGYPIDFLKQKSDGFGRILLEGLSQQLRAKLTFYNEAGACCMIKF